MKTNTPMNALVKLIEDLGTQRAAASMIGVTEAYVSDIIRGRRKISKNVAKALGFDIRIKRKKYTYKNG